VIQKTLEGDYQLDDKRWKLISSEAKDLVTKLLENDPNQRISIEEALIHPWFDKFPQLQVYSSFQV
jgi:serine/threonine protein kinase